MRRLCIHTHIQFARRLTPRTLRTAPVKITVIRPPTVLTAAYHFRTFTVFAHSIDVGTHPGRSVGPHTHRPTPMDPQPKPQLPILPISPMHTSIEASNDVIFA